MKFVRFKAGHGKNALDVPCLRMLARLIDGFVQIGSRNARIEVAFWVERGLLLAEYGRRLEDKDLVDDERGRIKGRLQAVLRSMRTSIEDCERRALETVTRRQADL